MDQEENFEDREVQSVVRCNVKFLVGIDDCSNEWEYGNEQLKCYQEEYSLRMGDRLSWYPNVTRFRNDHNGYEPNNTPYTIDGRNSRK